MTEAEELLYEMRRKFKSNPHGHGEVLMDNISPADLLEWSKQVDAYRRRSVLKKSFMGRSYIEVLKNLAFGMVMGAGGIVLGVGLGHWVSWMLGVAS